MPRTIRAQEKQQPPAQSCVRRHMRKATQGPPKLKNSWPGMAQEQCGVWAMLTVKAASEAVPGRLGWRGGWGPEAQGTSQERLTANSVTVSQFGGVPWFFAVGE